MPANAALRDYLKTRRSVGIGFLKDPGPTPDELQDILTLGVRVPAWTLDCRSGVTSPSDGWRVGAGGALGRAIFVLTSAPSGALSHLCRHCIQEQP